MLLLCTSWGEVIPFPRIVEQAIADDYLARGWRLYRVLE